MSSEGLIRIAATAAKSLQLCPTLCNPIDGSPPRLPHPWDSPGKNTGVGCHFLLQCMRVKSESEVAQLCPTLSDPMDYSPPGSSIQAPPPMGFSRQEYWSGVPLPSQIILPTTEQNLALDLSLVFWSHGSAKSLKFIESCVGPRGSAEWKPESTVLVGSGLPQGRCVV